MSPDELSVILLGLVGVFLQLIFMYVPKLKDWYEAQANKGLIMLGVVVGTGLIYFGLGCTTWAVLLGITLSCDVSGAYLLLRALFIIATSQQLSYLFTRKNAVLQR